MAKIVSETILEVMSIVPATTFEKGEPIYQIMFGKRVEVTPEIVERVKKANQIPPIGNTITETALIIYTKFAAPYLIGSNWIIKYDSEGVLNLVKK